MIDENNTSAQPATGAIDDDNDDDNDDDGDDGDDGVYRQLVSVKI